MFTTDIILSETMDFGLQLNKSYEIEVGKENFCKCKWPRPFKSDRGISQPNKVRGPFANYQLNIVIVILQNSKRQLALCEFVFIFPSQQKSLER